MDVDERCKLIDRIFVVIFFAGILLLLNAVFDYATRPKKVFEYDARDLNLNDGDPVEKWKSNGSHTD